MKNSILNQVENTFHKVDVITEYDLLDLNILQEAARMKGQQLNNPNYTLESFIQDAAIIAATNMLTETNN
jgi:hypothetical protein